MVDLGNETQTRMIAEQVAEATIIKFSQTHPETQKMDIPAPLKWAGAIVAALMTAGVIGIAGWLVTSVSGMQETLARMDERTRISAEQQTKQTEEVQRRLTRLERFHETH